MHIIEKVVAAVSLRDIFSRDRAVEKLHHVFRERISAPFEVFGYLLFEGHLAAAVDVAERIQTESSPKRGGIVIVASRDLSLRKIDPAI